MFKNAYKIRLLIAGIIFILSILAMYGIYFFKVLDLQFTALFQRALVTATFGSIALLAVIVFLTIIFGRFYCSIICPFGIFQEFAAIVLRNKKKNSKTNNYPYKHFICALTFGALFAGSAILIRYIDPYTLFGAFFSFTVLGIIFAIFILILVFFKNRFFCTNICPVGAFLGSCSKNAVNTMNIDTEKCVSCRMCEKNCPSGCIDIENKNIDNEMCIKCLKCYSICPKRAIYYGHKKQKFSSSRRNALIKISIGALFAAGYLTGMNFAKKVSKTLKNIILPPGSKHANRMANKCLNCNLCIKNCPNNIIVKADEKCNTVHIDYDKGEGYCKYDCHKCAQVCPSGAIKRIPIEEKQNTRIAMAVINEQTCQKCAKCIKSCPKGAITIEIGQAAKIDGSKCIGCNKCQKTCPYNAIQIFPIKEQIIV